MRRHHPERPFTYKQLDARQRQIARELSQGKGQATLLLSEVAPVITYGRRTPSSDLLGLKLRDSELTEVYATDRGGYATYHGPGQWVLFPVGTLEQWVGDSRGIQKLMTSLLEIALDVGLLYNSTAHLRDGAELGAWTSQGKFAAVGIHVQGGMVFHGLSVNGFRTSQSFQGLRPCGLDAPVDFLLSEGCPQEEFEKLGDQILEVALKLLSPVLVSSDTSC
jgi:lipoyl(octanoyl) transferase